MVAARQALHERTAMVCGGPQMVAHTLEQLTLAGMHAHHIKYEHFYYAAADEHADEHSARTALTRSGDIR
jgi:ferredoxin-NADP reductase